MATEEEILEDLRMRVETRCSLFLQEHNRKHTDEDLAQDDEFRGMLEQYRVQKKLVAEHVARGSEAGRPVGACRFFISRKQRFCSNMRSSESAEGYCTSHVHATNPEDCDEATLASTGAESKRKTNMKRQPKHMLNPYTIKDATQAPDWGNVYADPLKPLLVDIGCAKGRWVHKLASEKEVRLERHGKGYNYCGVELYAPLVEMANSSLPKEPGNLFFVAANILNSLKSLEFPNLDTVCIQFPDPWIKKAKRRTLSDALARDLVDVLPVGGQVFICSDYLELAYDMRAVLLRTGAFEQISEPLCSVTVLGARGGRGKALPLGDDGVGRVPLCASAVAWGHLAFERRRSVWLKSRPFVVGTERDEVCEVKWRPSYKALFVRK